LLNGSFNGVYAAMAVHILNALVGSIEKTGGVMAQRYYAPAAWDALPRDSVAAKGRKSARVDGAGTQFPLARHAYQAVADNILAGYPLEVLFLYDANPVFETPGGSRFVDAFEKIPFIVSFSTFADETASYADLILPEPTFLERWQDDAIEGLGYPGVGLRQPAIDPIHDTLNTPDFFIQVAKAMGGTVAKAFPWESYEEVLQFRLANIGTDWDTLKELGVWLQPGYRFARRGSQTWVEDVIGRDRQNAPRDGYFDFYSRELFAVLGDMSKDALSAAGISQSGDAVNLPHHEPTPENDSGYHLMLNVVTLMSLGPVSAAANMPTLQEISGMTVGETWGSWLEMNPETAHELDLHDKDIVWIESSYGKVKTKLRYVAGVRPDVVNLPYNQGHKAVGRWAKDRGVNGLDLLNPMTEPISGLAAFTNTYVKVYRA
jgi:anaerobic selenocysteine-containing dehydrogenase